MVRIAARRRREAVIPPVGWGHIIIVRWVCDASRALGRWRRHDVGVGMAQKTDECVFVCAITHRCSVRDVDDV